MYLMTVLTGGGGRFLSVQSTWYNAKNLQDVSAIGPSSVVQNRTCKISVTADLIEGGKCKCDMIA